jgi:hypothetical protein
MPAGMLENRLSFDLLGKIRRPCDRENMKFSILFLSEIKTERECFVGRFRTVIGD